LRFGETTVSAGAALEELGADDAADNNDEPNYDGHEQLVQDPDW